jgi:transposase
MERCVGRQIQHDVLEHYRFRAIKLRQKGWTVSAIAEAFGVHRRAVTRWLTNYREGGKKALLSKKANGPNFKLTEQEMKALIIIFKDNAMNYGFETPLWTCKMIQQLIKKRMGKKIHTTNIMRWLDRWNYTNQKPQRQASQRDEKAVKKWLTEEWPKIKAHCRRWQAMLYFQDECGVSLTAVLGKTWAPKGKTPIVKVTGKKGGLCVTSAISPVGKMVFRIEKEKIKAEQHIEFLQQIMKQHPHRKIIVIEDQARPHISGKVRQYVNQHKNRFAVYYLPSYAPELNPDEHVWAYLKAHQLKTHQAQNTKELKKLVIRKMQSIQRRKPLINSFFINTYVL